MRLIEISPFAWDDLHAASQWLEAARDGSAELFRADFRRVLERMQRAPELPPILGRDVRRLLMDTFKYHVYYRVFPDSIVVVAVVHAHRHPRVWKKLLRQRSTM
ncbi:MAG TPA: type II toxin-antitoxin system RelE/ParE family toxin [Planctomycetota bacterium]|jgi:plasmid stabilization system protein ParE